MNRPRFVRIVNCSLSGILRFLYLAGPSVRGQGPWPACSLKSTDSWSRDHNPHGEKHLPSHLTGQHLARFHRNTADAYVATSKYTPIPEALPDFSLLQSQDDHSQDLQRLP